MEIRPILSALLRQRTGPLLVAVQVALSLAILANALFVVQQRLATSDRPSGVADERNTGYVFNRPLRKLSHPEVIAEQRRQVALVGAIPGVKSVAWTSQMPMSRSGNNGSVRANPDQVKESATPSQYFVHPGFVDTLGLKVVEGRDFTEADLLEQDPDVDTGDRAPRGVIITKALGEALWPGETRFVGRSFVIGLSGDRNTQVIGVVDRLQTVGAGDGAAGEHSLLLPLRISIGHSRIVVRAEPGQLDRILAAANDAIRTTAPVPVRTFTRSVHEDRVNRYKNEKALAWMLIAVSLLLLVVTVSGIVGMTSLRVAQRRKQIGVRRALGARWIDILRYFITENLMITTGGIVAGLLLALLLNRLLMANLAMARLPIEYLAGGAAALWVLGIAAVYGPASRAASTSPAIATRTA